MVSTRPLKTTLGPYRFASATLVEDPGFRDWLDLDVFRGASIFVAEETDDGDLWWYSNESPDTPTGVRVMNFGYRLRRGPVWVMLPNKEKALLQGVDLTTYRQHFGIDAASEFVPDLAYIETLEKNG